MFRYSSSFSILTHDKTYALAEALKITNYAAVGLMVSLWTWACVNATDGDLTPYPPRAIAEATGWHKKPDNLYQTLLDIRLLEHQDGHVVIRNWEKYAVLLIEMMENQKKKTRARVERYRDKKKQEQEDCNVTETYLTQEVTPLQNQTEQNNMFYDGDDDAHAREEDEVNSLILRTFTKYFERSPTQHEQEEVLRLMRWIYISSENPNPEILPTEDDITLLEYAFEQAANVNQKSVSYLNGIYHNFRLRKIKTEDDLISYDFERDQKRFSSYEAKTNTKYLAFRPQGAERFIRVKTLGEEYEFASIRNRILRQSVPKIPTKSTRTTIYFRFQGLFRTKKKTGGLRGLYLYYCYRMGILPKNKPRKAVHPLLAEDLRFLDRFTEQMALLCKNKINTVDRLHDFTAKTEEKIKQLTAERNQLNTVLRRKCPPENYDILRNRRNLLSKQLSVLRKDVRTARSIEAQGQKMNANLQAVRESKNIRQKMRSREKRKMIR